MSAPVRALHNPYIAFKASNARAGSPHFSSSRLMRPALLNPLFASVTSLPGVGPKQDKLFRYLLGRDETPRLIDLLFHLPASVIDRRARPKIRDAVPGSVVTLEVTVARHRPAPPGRSRAPHLVYASDEKIGRAHV
jgi:ATP-dependent DNA helicase RecG